MIINNNPATRLSGILNEFRKEEYRELSIANTCSKIFNFNDKDISEVFLIIGEIFTLLKDTKKDILARKFIDEELFINTFNKLERALSNINPFMRTRELIGNFDEATLMGLRFCAEIIAPNYESFDIDEAKLNKILEDIDNLCKQSIDFALPKEMQDIISKNLDNIRNAILGYKIFGSEKIRENVDLTIMQAVRNAERIKEHSDSSLIKNFFDLLSRLDTLLNVASKLNEIIAPILPRLIGA